MTDLLATAGTVTPAPGYTLADRYTRDDGRVFLSGVQALARIALEQLRVDHGQGHNTAAFVSGYPGSPLAGFDREAAAAARLAGDRTFVARPGLNEELAATAVMGTQLAMEAGGPRFDGVIGIWYGKAPGLDRASDAIRHAQFAGTSRLGGVLALVGDDPAAKSSTLPSSSDATMVDLHMPILYPGDVQDALDLGRHGIALSRASGLWTGLKVVAPVADGTGTVDLDPRRVQPAMPVFMVDGKPYVHHPSGRLLAPYTLEVERDFQDVRLEIAREYGALNRLNRVTADPSDAWIGIAASGYTYYEVLEALRLLGFPTLAEIEAVGIRLLQFRMPVPFDRRVVREFAHGLSEIFVIEEKNPTLEWLIKDALYGWNERPLVVGKHDADGSARLIPLTGHVDADAILEPLRRHLLRRISGERLAPLPRRGRELIPLTAARAPFFCSGCPHNWGTKVPEGSLYGAGIGCHGMTTLMDEERVGELAGITAMGNEGAQWVGMSPFVTTPHLFQNLGDGTYFHSGQLAVRFAIAAHANITYKLLYNGTVAMTGGQDPQGAVAVPELVQILLLEGVKRVLITSDDPGRYDDVKLPTGVQVWDRTRIVEAQELLAKIEGVTVLIHDQRCAAEKRRDRKREKIATPTTRVVINSRVCEGCGDCGDKSNCLSVQPADTPFGRKTQIHQTSCNLDYSCLQGDCPSFATIETPLGKGAKHSQHTVPSLDTIRVSEPVHKMNAAAYTVRMPGIGGTGVVTVSQVLGTAAMLDGLQVRGLDQTGLSQKAGMVVSDIRISTTDPLPSNKATHGTVDLLLALDLLAAASDSQLATASATTTVVVASTTNTATGDMVVHPDHAYPELTTLRNRVDSYSRAHDNLWVDAGRITEGLFGDATTANVFLLGVAFQAGFVPVTAMSLEHAIELNGVAVSRNLAALGWGRRWVIDAAAVERAAGLVDDGGSAAATTSGRPAATVVPARLRSRIEAVSTDTAVRDALSLRVSDLVGFQNEKYAATYLGRIEQVAAAEQHVALGSHALTDTVVANLHKLMAYKDEYEVARLLLLPSERTAAEAVGGAGGVVRYHLHPPMLRALGMKNKIKLGPRSTPVFRALAAAKRLRNTPADIFGYAEVRRVERAMIAEYNRALDTILARLTPANLAEATAIAALPDQVRGYEHIKLRRATAYRAELALRIAAFDATTTSTAK